MKIINQEKIVNKLFLNISKASKTGFDFEEFYKNISKLDSMRTKRYHYKYDAMGYFYNCILQATETYHNSNIFKFYELFRGVIISINISSYSSALTIGRTIIEHYAMLLYMAEKLDKLLKKKEYYDYFSLINSMTIPTSQRKILKKYKRIHVNDALKTLGSSLGEEKKTRKKYIKNVLKVYGDISEFVHPVSPAVIMYEHEFIERTDNKTNPLGMTYEMKTAFSYNSENTQKTVFQYLRLIMTFATSAVEALDGFKTQIIEKLKSKEEIIIKNFVLDIKQSRSLPDKFSEHLDFKYSKSPKK